MNLRRPLLALVALGCTTMPGAPGAPGGAVDMELRGFPDAILSEQSSGYSASQRLVIRDAEGWQQFWDAVYPTTGARPPLPDVDFADEMVIAVGTGSRPSDGYAIHIDGVREANGDIWVFVRTVTPSLSCDRTPILTAPVAAVRVDRRDGYATFVNSGETTVCD